MGEVRRHFALMQVQKMWPTQRSRACLTIASLSLVATICVVRSVHATSEKKSDCRRVGNGRRVFVSPTALHIILERSDDSNASGNQFKTTPPVLSQATARQRRTRRRRATC